jgi:hypothetical protein
MKLQNLILLLVFVSLYSCKAFIRCNANRMEKEEDNRNYIKTNATSALENYYKEEAAKEGGTITVANNIYANAVLEKNDSTFVEFIVNGKYRVQGLSDTTWKPLVNEKSTWFYEEKNGMVYITSLDQ